MGAHAGGDARFQKLRRDYLLGRRRSGTRESGNGTDNGWLTNDCAEVLRECGGGRFCEHGRQRTSNCLECDGGIVPQLI